MSVTFSTQSVIQSFGFADCGCVRSTFAHVGRNGQPWLCSRITQRALKSPDAETGETWRSSEVFQLTLLFYCQSLGSDVGAVMWDAITGGSWVEGSSLYDLCSFLWVDIYLKMKKKNMLMYRLYSEPIKSEFLGEGLQNESVFFRASGVQQSEAKVDSPCSFLITNVRMLNSLLTHNLLD